MTDGLHRSLHILMGDIILALSPCPSSSMQFQPPPWLPTRWGMWLMGNSHGPEEKHLSIRVKALGIRTGCKHHSNPYAFMQPLGLIWAGFSTIWAVLPKHGWQLCLCVGRKKFHPACFNSIHTRWREMRNSRSWAYSSKYNSAML